MTPGPRNLITDIPGLKVGQARDLAIATGTTILTAEAPFTAAVHIMGGAPGTRETDLLAPENLVGRVDAIALSGGSAFGLGAAEGVMAALRAHGRGFPAGPARVPIVPAAILFDLAHGDQSWQGSPYPALGRAAYEAAAEIFLLGSHGAGTGATVAGLKGGIGSASARLPGGPAIGALVVVNAVGTACHPKTGQFWAAPFELAGEFGGYGIAPPPPDPLPTKLATPGEATTIAIVATDAAFDKAGLKRLAIAAHDGLARALMPSHTPFDGDLVFAVSTGTAPAPDPATLLPLGHAAATVLARATARGIFAADAIAAVPLPTWAERHR